MISSARPKWISCWAIRNKMATREHAWPWQPNGGKVIRGLAQDRFVRKQRISLQLRHGPNGAGGRSWLRCCASGAAVCMGAEKHEVSGEPDWRHVSKSHVERQNLTMRMGMRRFTRLTNAFSKKVENLEAAVALHYMHYNFCRIHQTLRVTPAMEAGLADHVWELEELVALLD
jgi:hypothetical protein